MLVVFHPEIMNQFTVDYSLPKHDYLWKQFQPLTNCLDLLTLEGPLWKTWRQIFNPGFSAKNLIRFVPDMIEEVGVFRDWLKSATISGNVIKLAPAAERLTIDIAGRVIL
jgi:cytochrome P450